LHIRPRALRSKLLLAALSCLAGCLLVEAGARWRYRSIELYRSWRWVVETHLIDQSWEEFLERQSRLQAARKRQGMERGRSHAVFGWTYNPGFEIDEPDLGLSIHINSHALRGEEFPAEKPPGEVRIVCLGGSTTAGEEVLDPQTYPAQLQVILRERLPARSIRVINAGVPTYALKHSLDLYALNLRRFEPDFVTIYHGINDLFQYAHEGVEISPRRNYNRRPLAPFVFQGDAADDGGSLFGEILWAFERRSLAWQLLHDRLLTETPLVTTDPARVEAGLRLYRLRLDELLDEISGSGATAVPMTFALSYPGDFSPERAQRIEKSLRIWLDPAGIALEDGPGVIAAQNRALAELAGQRGLPLADVAAAVPADAGHFVDSCHLTAQGNRRIAEVLADTLAPLLQAEH